MPRHRLMSDDFSASRSSAGRERRRRWSGEEKLRIVEETLTSGDSVSAVARRHGVAPNLLYRWRRLVTEGGAVAVQADDGVTGQWRGAASGGADARAGAPARAQDARGRDPQGSAREVAGKKTDLARAVAADGRFPVKAVAETLGVARSNLVERLKDRGRPRQRYCKAEDAALLPRVRRLVDERPTYGYRRITALLNRELAREGWPRVNHKRVYRLMQVHGLLLARHHGPSARPEPRRQGRRHGLEPALVFGRLRVHLLERRDRPGDLRHGRP